MMVIKPLWDDETRTIVRLDFSVRWTWADMQTACAEAETMTKTVAHQVERILYFHEGGRHLPVGAMRQVRLLGQTAPLGMTVLVGANTVMRAFWDAFRRVYPETARQLNVHFVDSLDEARAFIAARRADCA